MDSMYESAKTYAGVLKNCSLPQVADWGVEDVNRVNEWAEYFDKVQKRIANRSSVVKKLDGKLREIGRDLGVRFGGEELCYEFIAHSFEYSTKCLLDNPALPDELKEVVSSRCPHVAQQHLMEVEDTQLLFSSLSTIHEKLAPHQSVSDLMLDLRSLEAEYLRKDLAWALGGGEPGKGWPSVRGRLESLARVEGGMEVILLSLLQSNKGDTGTQWHVPNGPSHTDLLDPARGAILEWLVQTARFRDDTTRREKVGTLGTNESGGPEEGDNGSISDRFWHTKHCKLLALVSIRYFNFFKEHLKFLVARMEVLEREREEASLGLLGESSDISPARGQQQSFDGGMAWITAHWVELVRVGGKVEEVCQALLMKKSQHVSQISLEEKATLAGCALTLAPPHDSVWRTVLKQIRSEMMMVGN